MPPLAAFPLPLVSGAPPDGYGWPESDKVSSESGTSVFQTGIDQRDRFFGRCRCIICGIGSSPQQSHIITSSEDGIWTDLKGRVWIPEHAKNQPHHEPRNGLLLCKNDYLSFKANVFFIRFFPNIQKFVLINYSNHPDYQQFHGKAIAIDIKDHHAPFPSLFIIHEMRVCGYYPFQTTPPNLPDDINWQDRVLTDDVFNDVSGSFYRNRLPVNDNNSDFKQQLQLQPTTSKGGVSFGTHPLELNESVIADILAATYAMPSWRACQIEGTSWTGTAEENTQKYLSISQGP